MAYTYTRAQKRAEISRELSMRRKVYPRQVASGRMSEEEAESHIRIMEAIWDDYTEQADKRQLQLQLA